MAKALPAVQSLWLPYGLLPWVTGQPSRVGGTGDRVDEAGSAGRVAAAVHAAGMVGQQVLGLRAHGDKEARIGGPGVGVLRRD